MVGGEPPMPAEPTRGLLLLLLLLLLLPPPLLPPLLPGKRRFARGKLELLPLGARSLLPLEQGVGEPGVALPTAVALSDAFNTPPPPEDRRLRLLDAVR